MSDSPYKLDFFQTITDIHFGGDWIGFGCICSSSHGQSIFLDIPTEAGGTPGYVLMDGGGPPSGLKSAPFDGGYPSTLNGWPAVTPADLQGQLVTAAGGPITGFGAAAQGAGDTEDVVYMQLGTGTIPSETFSITCRLTGDPDNALLLYGGFVTKNAMKPGPFPNTFDPGGITLPPLFEFGFSAHTTQITIVVDTTARTMTVLT